MELVHKGQTRYRFTGVPLAGYQLQALGSIGHAQRLDKLMDEIEPSLSQCPFCGGKAVIQAVWTYLKPGIMIQCRSCRCGTTRILEGTNILQQHTTLEQAITQAVNRWETRKESGDKEHEI